MNEVRKSMGILVALLLLAGVGCGDDSSSDDPSAGDGNADAGMMDDDDGTSTSTAGDGDGDGDATTDDGTSAAGDGDGDGAPAEVACDDGLQDNDGDGECMEACSDAVDCGNGDCNDAAGTILCQCDVGYDSDADGVCSECAPGHEGDDCTDCSEGYIASTRINGACIADPCASVECGNAGSCEVVDDAAECTCDLGFAGDACNVCADGYDGVACDTCEAEYTQQGDGSCLPDVCVDKDCGAGTCVFEAPDTALCECDTAYAVAEDGTCTDCALGYRKVDEACILDLPVQGEKLTVWFDMMPADGNGPNVLKSGDNVLIWSAEKGNRAAYQEAPDAAPTQINAFALSYLSFDGVDDELKVNDLPLDNQSYTIFVAFDPDGEGSQAVLAGVNTDNTSQHGMLIRSQLGGTQVRFLHRSPLGTSGGDNVISGEVAAPGLIEPFQIVTAERRMDGETLVQNLFVDDDVAFTSTSDPAFGEAVLDMLIGVQDGSGTNPFLGKIGEIVVYNGEITEEERDSVQAYLKAKWVPRGQVGEFMPGIKL